MSFHSLAVWFNEKHTIKIINWTYVFEKGIQIAAIAYLME
jgi:hypothetical protein